LRKRKGKTAWKGIQPVRRNKNETDNWGDEKASHLVLLYIDPGDNVSHWFSRGVHDRLDRFVNRSAPPEPAHCICR
jgi:hypothetical protein